MATLVRTRAGSSSLCVNSCFSYFVLGVLLLNAVLTVRAHNANSHKDKGWEQFTNAVIQWLNRNLEGVVFILWGGYAQKKGASIDKVSFKIKETHIRVL